jgi:hypothetical protein
LPFSRKVNRGAYTILAGTPFNKPDLPGIQLPSHAPNATTAQIGAANRTYNHNLAEYRTYAAVKEVIRQQILTAIQPVYYKALEDDTFGYSDVTILNLLTDLDNTYGNVTQADLIANLGAHPQHLHHRHYRRRSHIRRYHYRPEFSFTPKSGHLAMSAHAITTWYDKEEADQTWANFRAHFNKQKKNACDASLPKPPDITAPARPSHRPRQRPTIIDHNAGSTGCYVNLVCPTSVVVMQARNGFWREDPWISISRLCLRCL